MKMDLNSKAYFLMKGLFLKIQGFHLTATECNFKTMAETLQSYKNKTHLPASQHILFIILTYNAHIPYSHAPRAEKKKCRLPAVSCDT